MTKTNSVSVAGTASIPEVVIGGDAPLTILCGPCVIESEEHALMMAEAISEVCGELSLPLVYKSSFDKANRTSDSSFRGMGIEAGLDILSKVKEKFKVPLISDIHSPEQAKIAAKSLDCLLYTSPSPRDS